MSSPAVPTPPDLIARLGLVGLSSLEPVVLASLATRAPMLLIGPHGAGKSLLLERLATALGLEWRHYNAALVNFDDLVGYPLPDANGELRFVQTPASIWGAQAVFVDEISRARIDVQNRLFPIIHERRVQGLALPDLQHRWAAMNPPSADDDADDAPYAGSLPLDVALADRFALHLRVPDWRAFDDTAQEAVIRAADAPPAADAGALWSAAIARTRERLPMVRAQWGASLARYVRLLAALLAQAKAPLSARRAGMLATNAAAVHAARLASDADALIDDSAWIATAASMPFAASGHRLDDGKLLACHREAWRIAAVAPDDPMGPILAEPDPVSRVLLAFAAAKLPDGELTSIVTDALASAPDGTRHALAAWLFDSGHVERLSVVAADTAAEVYRDLACVQDVVEHVQPNGPRHRTWRRIQQCVGALPAGPEAEETGNLLATLFAAKRLGSEAEVDAVAARLAETRARLAASEWV